MSDKVNEFHRINDPRAKRAMDQIELIEKSAASMRLPEERAKLLQRIANYLTPSQGPMPTPAHAPHGREVMGGKHVEATPRVAKEMSAMANLSTQQLIDRMIACGAELAKRRQ